MDFLLELLSHIDSAYSPLNIVTLEQKPLLVPRSFVYKCSFLNDLLEFIPASEEVAIIVPDVSAQCISDISTLVNHGFLFTEEEFSIVKLTKLINEINALGEMFGVNIKPSSIELESKDRVCSSNIDSALESEKEYEARIPRSIHTEVKCTAGTSDLNRSQPQNANVTVASFAKWCPSIANLVDHNISCGVVVPESNHNNIDQHTQRSSWKCFQCGIGKESREGLVLHLRMKHRILKCSFCDYFTCRIENFSALRNHQKKHVSALKLKQKLQKGRTFSQKSITRNETDLSTYVGENTALDHSQGTTEKHDKECSEDIFDGLIIEERAERL